MNHVEKLIAGKHLRNVSAHPDDLIPNGHLNYIANQLGVYVDEALLTVGSAGKNLRAHNEPSFDVQKGHRVFEEQNAIKEYGLAGLVVYDGEDGNLRRDIPRLAQLVGQHALEDEIDILISTEGLVDHSDHVAAGVIALEAARWVVQQGRGIGVLNLQLDSSGEWVAPATRESESAIFRSTRHHVSQWKQSDIPVEGWELTPSGGYMHPDDYASLLVYPLQRDATYMYASASELLHQQPQLAGTHV